MLAALACTCRGKQVRWIVVLVVTLVVVAHAAQPVISEARHAVRGTSPAAVDVTFTIGGADSASCWIFLFAHSLAGEYIPMTSFMNAGTPLRLNELATIRFAPGPHTITWFPEGDLSTHALDQLVIHVKASDSGRVAPGRFLIIDLSGGPSATAYPKEFQDFVDVRQDVCKTAKLVLRELPNGSWAGVYEVTQEQYRLVTGATPSSFRGNPKRPVEQVSWDDIEKPDGFVDRIRRRTGLSGFDLPYETLWEYACRAGTTGDDNDHSPKTDRGSHRATMMLNIAWCFGNSGGTTHDVGGKQANAWGLYDTLGNVLEWTLTASSPYRIRRGGSWFNSASDCTTVNRFSYYPDIRHDNAGFRLFAPAGLQ